MVQVARTLDQHSPFETGWDSPTPPRVSSSFLRCGDVIDLADVTRLLREEWNGAQPRLLLAAMISRLLPDLIGNRFRVAMLRCAGVSIGHGTVIGGGVRIVGAGRSQDRLHIGERGWINAGCYFDVSARIDVGDDVAIGQQVLFLTQSHEVAGSSRRAGALTTAPIIVGNGCWIGARSVILPGVTVGAGAIVAAGAVVTADVPANALAGGVPARVIRALGGEAESGDQP